MATKTGSQLLVVVFQVLLLGLGSSAIAETGTNEFVKHDGPGEWDGYLAMQVPFDPIADEFVKLLKRERRPLSSRGEAHITVITPIEFWNVLKPQGVTMTDVDGIAERLKIQTSKYKVKCLGHGTAQVDNKPESTFFYVVESKDLLEIRRQIQKLFLEKGGDPKKFEATHFYPHITIAFTKRDLHEADGVIKDEKLCEPH